MEDKSKEKLTRQINLTKYENIVFMYQYLNHGITENNSMIELTPNESGRVKKKKVVKKRHIVKKKYHIKK